MAEGAREGKPLTRPGVWSFRIFRRAVMGALAGAGIGLCVGALGSLAGGLAEQAFPITVTSWEMIGLVILIVCTVYGLLFGALGALSGTWRRGLLIGAVLSGLVCVGVLAIDPCNTTPCTVDVWWVTVWMIAMGAAGAVGGVVRQRLDKKDAPAKA